MPEERYVACTLRAAPASQLRASRRTSVPRRSHARSVLLRISINFVAGDGRSTRGPSSKLCAYLSASGTRYCAKPLPLAPPPLVFWPVDEGKGAWELRAPSPPPPPVSVGERATSLDHRPNCHITPTDPSPAVLFARLSSSSSTPLSLSAAHTTVLTFVHILSGSTLYRLKAAIGVHILTRALEAEYTCGQRAYEHHIITQHFG